MLSTILTALAAIVVVLLLIAFGIFIGIIGLAGFVIGEIIK